MAIFGYLSLVPKIKTLKSIKIRWVKHAAHTREGSVAYVALVGKPEGKGPTWNTRHRWEDNIKMNLQEVVCGGGGAWTGLMWLRIRTSGRLL